MTAITAQFACLLCYSYPQVLGRRLVLTVPDLTETTTAPTKTTVLFQLTFHYLVMGPPTGPKIRWMRCNRQPQRKRKRERERERETGRQIDPQRSN